MVSEDDRKLHTDFTAEVRKRQISSSENFDKSVLTLSSGGLAFSLGFLKDFVPISKAVCGWALYTSWGSLTAATCLTMVSFLVAEKAQDFQQKIADDYYLEGDEKAFSRVNPWNRLTIWLNRCSGACFLVGVVLTTVFVATNLSGGQAMSEAKRATTNDGIPSPQLMQKISVPTDMQRGMPAPTMTAKVPVSPQNIPAAAPSAPVTATSGQGAKK